MNLRNEIQAAKMRLRAVQGKLDRARTRKERDAIWAQAFHDKLIATARLKPAAATDQSPLAANRQLKKTAPASSKVTPITHGLKTPHRRQPRCPDANSTDTAQSRA
jgi:hypothetical protein